MLGTCLVVVLVSSEKRSLELCFVGLVVFSGDIPACGLFLMPSSSSPISLLSPGISL